MDGSVYEKISEYARYLNIDLGAQEIATLAMDKAMTEAELDAISNTFEYLRDKKRETIVSTLLRLSRLPLKEPKPSRPKASAPR